MVSKRYNFPLSISHFPFGISLCLLIVLVCATALGARGRKGRAVRRHTDERVYLRHADTLSYDIYGAHPDAQFLRGNVVFDHKGMHLTCDTAFFYEATNSFQAFGHVRMRQGDTLSLASDQAYYDGNDELGHAYHNVVMTHRKSVLHCDTLDYDRMYGIADAYGAAGIKLVNGKDVLTADWGRHFTDTRQSEFYYNVVLTNDRGLRIDTDTLHYDERTTLAHVLGPSTILNGASRVNTVDSYYNTHTEASRLLGRSTVHNGPKEITADTLLHNDRTGQNDGYGRVVYRDTVNRNMLLAERFHYNDQTGTGLATDSAVVADYSQGPDTLWLHGDTIRLKTFAIGTDSVRREVYCYNHVRAFRADLQGVCDSLVYHSQDSCATMYREPVVWSRGSQLTGDMIKVFLNDSTVEHAEVLTNAFAVERLATDTTRYNQVASTNMFAYYRDGELRENQAIGNVLLVYYPIDESDTSIIGLNYTETDTLKMFLRPGQQLDRIWMSKAEGTLYPLTQTPPDKPRLPGFLWLDDIRPKTKDDIFIWKPRNEVKNKM